MFAALTGRSGHGLTQRPTTLTNYGTSARPLVSRSCSLHSRAAQATASLNALQPSPTTVLPLGLWSPAHVRCTHGPLRPRPHSTPYNPHQLRYFRSASGLPLMFAALTGRSGHGLTQRPTTLTNYGTSARPLVSRSCSLHSRAAQATASLNALQPSPTTVLPLGLWSPAHVRCTHGPLRPRPHSTPYNPHQLRYFRSASGLPSGSVTAVGRRGRMLGTHPDSHSMKATSDGGQELSVMACRWPVTARLGGSL